MKLRLYSDIHLDWYHPQKLWYPPEMPNDKETTLILAGDLWVGTRWIRTFDTGTRGEFAAYEINWIQRVANQFKQVLVVLGNHDYWDGLTILTGAKRCNDMLQDIGIYNVKVLDCDTYQEDNVLFIGATLWTDISNRDPLAMWNMPRMMHYDGKIAYATGDNGAWERFTSEKWVKTHDKHRRYIELILEQNKDKKCVVITHHLPLYELGDPTYRGNMSNAYYASDLSSLLLNYDNLVLWCYGHTHHPNDSIFPNDGAGVRLLNNCLGYKGEQDTVKHEVLKL